MASKYTYSVNNDFPNGKVEAGKLDSEISASDITIALDYIETVSDNCDIWFKAALSGPEETTLSGVIAAHDGTPEVEPTSVNIASSDDGAHINTHIIDVPYDRSGKLRVHQTSRKLGCVICWSGVGDDDSDPSKVGGGEALTFRHNVGDTDPMVKYIDYNIAENETWLHEGYLTWKGGDLDKLSLQMVVRTATISGVTGGDKTVYGGYLVIPTAPGQGNVEVTSDLGDPTGGLVYIPNNDLDEPPVAYWDADYNTTTHRYENIRPNYTGTGRYNIFNYEIVVAEFVREIPLLDNGFIALNSSDTDQLGNGMRLKMIADTNDDVADHEWSVACIMCLHRQKTV